MGLLRGAVVHHGRMMAGVPAVVHHGGGARKQLISQNVEKGGLGLRGVAVMKVLVFLRSNCWNQ